MTRQQKRLSTRFALVVLAIWFIAWIVSWFATFGVARFQPSPPIAAPGGFFTGQVIVSEGRLIVLCSTSTFAVVAGSTPAQYRVILEKPTGSTPRFTDLIDWKWQRQAAVATSSPIYINLPIWPVVPIALYAFYRIYITRKRWRAGMKAGAAYCEECGYDLRGLALASACPECGAARARAQG